jgi:ATP-binding cassette subfamily F protein 3
VSLFTLRGVRKAYGSRVILDGLDLNVEDGARIGIVGDNGSGKTTLLRIIAGDEQEDAGQATRRRGLTVALLPQHPLGDDRSARETLHRARADLRSIDAELSRINVALNDPSVHGDATALERTLNRQAELLDRYDRAGGPAFEGRARSLLLQLGLEERELELPTSVLSGGQRKLIGLAAALVQDPALLLLDEPEAHLDLAGRQRLEDLVRDFDGAIVIVSHDRYLLDEMVTQIASMDRGRLRTWPGNYSAYALAREIELVRQQQAYVTQQKEIERLEDAIRRFKDWAHRVVDERHIKQARNKQRQIDRMEKVERPVLERRRIGLQLRPHERGGQRAFELRDVSVAFDEVPILLGIDLSVLHGERVGVVGENGAGKSVLLKSLVGEIQPADGEVWVGPSIRIGYLAQDQETLDPASTPVDTLREAHPLTEEGAVARLMSFLFSYEQVRRPIATLSGGERTRLQLLLLMLSGANLLVLDEPTNHLDIDSVEALEAALESFAGTAIFISHDRYFLDRMADRIVEVRDGGVASVPGGYSDWLDRHTLPSSR